MFIYCLCDIRLMLQFDVSDVTREGVGVSCQLMVGQSSVPHYQQLEEFTARLAPGEVRWLFCTQTNALFFIFDLHLFFPRLFVRQVNQTLLLLYLAVFSVSVPRNLRVFLVSIPGPNPARWPAAPSLAQSLSQRGDLEALQLPRTWLDSPSLKKALEGNSPWHLSFSRCPALWPQVFQSLLEGGVTDPARLVSLNLSGINQVLYAESRSVEDHLDPWTVGRLALCCPSVERLNLMHTHYHHKNPPGQDGQVHLFASLAKFKHLRSLTLPACALPDGISQQAQVSTNQKSSPFAGFTRSARVGLQYYRPDSDSSLLSDSTTALTQLSTGCPLLETLELIGPGFVSALPRLEACSRGRGEPRGMCAWAQAVNDTHLAALGGLSRLRRLTLAGLPGVRTGSGLVQLAKLCTDLRVLSLANLGSLSLMNYAPALRDALKLCTQLEELRLDTPTLATVKMLCT